LNMSVPFYQVLVLTCFILEIWASVPSAPFRLVRFRLEICTLLHGTSVGIGNFSMFMLMIQ